jgi:arginyl-tRNA synthetase
MIDFKAIFTAQLASVLNGQLSEEAISDLIETPKNPAHGDLAFPCFTLAKAFRKSPASIAEEAAFLIKGPYIEKAKAAGPYINIFFSKGAAGADILEVILKKGKEYGLLKDGAGKTAVLDFSSPNIAKPFSMGHLRSTVIGNALGNLAEKCGYTAVRINHLGDWGTQFGKLITAYKKWGNPDKVKEHPIKELLSLYIRFHEEAEADPSLEDEARSWFKELENGNKEAQALWNWFRDESLKEFQRVYDRLGIHFNSYNGEAFYNDKMKPVIEELMAKDLLAESDGAKVVLLPDEDLPPCLIKKSDGATLYATRDLAAAFYRRENYQFDHSLYIVGQEQSIHFRQVKSVIKKMGYEWADSMKHVPFGLYLKDGKKMSTRKGRVILLEEVLDEAVLLAKNSIEAKNPGLENKDEVAEAVGIGAILFHDLKNDRMNNIEFSLEDMLTFEGETGPYLQYTNARAYSLLRKADDIPSAVNGLTDPYSWEIIKLLYQYPEKIRQSYRQLSPSVLAKFLIEVAQAFNKYYGQVRILEKDAGMQARLALVKAVTIVLTDGMQTLGMKVPRQM